MSENVVVSKDVLQKALEFVTSKQWGTTPYMDVRVYEDAARLRDTLRAALAQPEPPPEAQTEAEKIAYCAGWWAAMGAKVMEQEPVAWLKTMYSGTRPRLEVDHLRKDTSIPVYTAPPRHEWQSLSEEEINETLDNNLEGGTSLFDICRAI